MTGMGLLAGAGRMGHRSQRGILLHQASLLISLSQYGFHLVQRGGLRQIIISAMSHGFDAG